MSAKQVVSAIIVGAAAVLVSVSTAHADLVISPVPTATDVFQSEPGASIPPGTGGYIGGSVIAGNTSLYQFTYGPPGLVPGATGDGNSIFLNEFWFGGPSNRAAAEAAGEFFCTKDITGHCVASTVGSSFAVPLAAGTDIPFTFDFNQNSDGTGGSTLVNDQTNNAVGAYMAQIGLGAANAGPGPVAYLGLSDQSYPGDHDFQDLTLRITPVPEPSSVVLLGSVLLGMGWRFRRKR